jgi:hypothetical protein
VTLGGLKRPFQIRCEERGCVGHVDPTERLRFLGLRASAWEISATGDHHPKGEDAGGGFGRNATRARPEGVASIAKLLRQRACIAGRVESP